MSRNKHKCVNEGLWLFNKLHWVTKHISFFMEETGRVSPRDPFQGGQWNDMQKLGIGGGGYDGGKAARQAEKRGMDNERHHQFFMCMEIILKVIIKSKY